MNYKNFAQITCALLVTTFLNNSILYAEEAKDYTVVAELSTDNFILDQHTGKYTLPENPANPKNIPNQISYVPPIYGNNNAQNSNNNGEDSGIVMEFPADQFTYDHNTGKFTAVQKPFASPATPSQNSTAPLATFNPRYNPEAAACCGQVQETCPCTPAAPTCCAAPGTFRLGLEFAGGRFIALDQNYGGVTLFTVPQASIAGIHPLLDLRAFKLESKNWAASAGLGFRKYNAEDRKVYGVNFFYDYREQRSHSYHQWGFGLELLSGCWEFHLNGYMPVGKTDNEISKRCQQFEDGMFAIYRENEYALRGLELTGGGRWCLCDDMSLYFAPGFYIYNNNDIGNVQGIQGVAEINWNNWLSFRLNASYDSKFKGRVQGIFELSIPFNFGCCPCECTCCECYLDRPIRRNDMIFFKRCTSIERNFDDCGSRNCSIR